MSLVRFLFFLHLQYFQRCNVYALSVHFSLARYSFLSLFSYESFSDIKAAAGLRCPHKSDKRKATRLLNARVNVNNDDGSATRERETENK